MGKSSRQLWKDYVDGRTTGKKAADAKEKKLHLHKYRGIILGIDPSLRGTGLAVVEMGSDGLMQLHHKETIRVPQSKTAIDCLATISERSEWVARHFNIHHVAVEQTIYVQNFKTAMILGTAKGAALGILAREGFDVFEYPPLRVKQAIAGNGRASKEQVAQMVSKFLNHRDWSGADETDAAAVALCHGFTHKVASDSIVG